MFNFFKRKTITDNAKDFEMQCKVAKIIIFQYLEIWFKQIFEKPDWKELFIDKPDMHETMAAEVMRYLLALDDNRGSEELKKASIMAKEHAEKWADDVMSQDKDFCELVIQTLRMEMFFCELGSNFKWRFENPQGIRMQEILMKYGDSVPESIDPKKYDKLIKKWIAWGYWIDSKKEKSL